MGNDYPGFYERHSRVGLGLLQHRLLYGNRGSIRRRARVLSTKSSAQVEEAKQQFLSLVWETDFSLMPKSAKVLSMSTLTLTPQPCACCCSCVVKTC